MEEERKEQEFFMPMIPPEVTAQMHKVTVAKGRPRFYDPAEVKAARAKLTANLSKYRPETPAVGPVVLEVKWCFPRGSHGDGEPRTTKPDTDNLQKLLKDCMTAVGFWRDDAQVFVDVCQKFWAEIPGIWIRVTEVEDE